ncbi:GIN domain-containing protein [Massilia sp. SM-13]|uniref:GIN domain-containing protein n=1 Tax=Pseudoduganella rhizocola TaxID=3382643 RepID=UPI0038B6AA48
MRRFLILSTLLLATAVHAAEEKRSFAPFRAIAIDGPIDLEVRAGKAQSVTIYGRDGFIKKVGMSVKAEELKITYADNKNVEMKSGDKIIITVPSLVKCVVEGAGQVQLFDIKEERMDLSFQGAGRLAGQGQVKWLRVRGQGVGEVDLRALKAERTDVNFEGIGDVKIHASDTLNAVVRGMGNLTYYGHPKQLNKSVMGLGDVKAGD